MHDENSKQKLSVRYTFESIYPNRQMMEELNRLYFSHKKASSLALIGRGEHKETRKSIKQRLLKMFRRK